MRRLSIVLVVAVATTLVPHWAMAGNQEVAEKIASSLQESGQLHGYRIGVKFQDGTAWLRGQVGSREQMNQALGVVYQTPGVTHVVNNLTIEETAAAPSQSASTTDSWTADAPQPASFTQPATADADVTPASAEQAAEPQLQQPSNATLAAGGERMNVSIAEAAPTPAVQPKAAPTPARVRVASMPIPAAYLQPAQPPAAAPAAPAPVPAPMGAAPVPQYVAPPANGMTAARYDQAYMPNNAWPSYAPYPNYAALTYPKQYSPTAWPYIGPFYPYPQVPLGWRKVTLQWHDGWWNLDFDDGSHKGPISGLFRPLGCR